MGLRAQRHRRLNSSENNVHSPQYPHEICSRASRRSTTYDLMDSIWWWIWGGRGDFISCVLDGSVELCARHQLTVMLVIGTQGCTCTSQRSTRIVYRYTCSSIVAACCLVEFLSAVGPQSASALSARSASPARKMPREGTLDAVRPWSRMPPCLSALTSGP